MTETRSKNSRSPIWRFFEPVDVKNTKCLLCESLYRNSGNTTNLIDHLKRRHRNSYARFQDLMKNQDETNEDNEIPIALENIKYEEEANQVLEMDIQNENTEQLIEATDEIEDPSIETDQLDGQIITEVNDGEKEFDIHDEHEVQIVKVF